MASSLIIVLAIVGCVCYGSGQSPSESQLQLSRVMSQFSQKLHKDLALDKVNSVYSPASIHIALSMAYLGASGKTADELRSTLQLDNLNDPHQLHQTWIKDMMSQDDVRVDIANSLWYNEQFDIFSDYKNQLKEKYLADVEKLDFSSNKPEERINDWVSNKTDGNIQEIIQPGKLSQDETLLALINAIFFNGTFDKPFSNESTREDDFTRPDGSKVKVNLMRQTNSFKVKELKSMNADALKLYFQGKRFSLNFISPKSTSGLRQIEEKLISGSEQLDSILYNMEEKDLEISVPKFKISATMDLKEALKKLGLEKSFTDEADFSRISSRRSKITDVNHKTIFEVQESGTVASAATSVTIGSRSIKPRFDLDHAFLFFLMDERQRVILFHGKVTDPTIEEIEIH